MWSESSVVSWVWGIKKIKRAGFCSVIKPTSALLQRRHHSLLLTARGELFGCGYNSNKVSWVLVHIEDQASWVLLSDKIDIRAIAAGGSHSLLLTARGELFACGFNEYGQLGLGHHENQASWVLLSDKTDICAIAAGELTSLFLNAAGELFGCGYNQSGAAGSRRY